MKIIAIAAVIAGLLAFNSAAAYVEPTPEQIKDVVQNPGRITQLINGATPEDAVHVLLEVVQGVIRQSLPDEETKTRIAFAAAALFRAMPDQAVELAKLIARKLPIDVLPTIVAAAAVVMGNQAPAVTEAFVSGLPREDAQMIRNAGSHPETVLPPSVVLALGVPVSHAATAMGRQPTAMPVAPPLTGAPGGATPQPPQPAPVPPIPPPPPQPPPPPVATNYAGL
jgi:cytochrome c556